MSELKPDFQMTEKKFEDIFTQIDLDRDGTINRLEMTQFIKVSLASDQQVNKDTGVIGSEWDW